MTASAATISLQPQGDPHIPWRITLIGNNYLG